MRSLELFSGAGGLAKGLENAGFEHVAFIESNKNACASLYENFDKNKVFFGDVKDFNFETLNNIDVVAGGPPCQPFSLGGKHKANQDTRDMFGYAINAVEKLEPKAFIFENVKGLLRSSFAEYFEYIILRLTYPTFKDGNESWQEHLNQLRKLSKCSYIGIKYDVSYKLVNAANYGAPQIRERVVIVGFRSDLNLSWHFPKETHSEERLLWEMFVTEEYWKRHDISKPNHLFDSPKLLEKINRLKSRYGLFEPENFAWQTVRDALSDVPDPRSEHDISDHIFRDGARTYAGHTGSDIDLPSKTIKAGNHGVPGGENMIRYEDESVRYFTVFEAKRIQTFPDNFVIKGSWGEAMRQIGNAVPIRLAEIIGKQIIATLN